MAVQFVNKVVLAPMMRGGNRTFRRIAHRFGAHILGGEMAHANNIVKGDSRELSLVSAQGEPGCFSAQIGGRGVPMLTEAAKRIEGRGASIIDLNAGCPVESYLQRGWGADLLRRGSHLAELVEALRNAVNLPVTVKIRTGWDRQNPNPVALAKFVEQGGASAVAVHARALGESYGIPANWSHIREIVQSVKIPVIGNGDIFTYKDALKMREETGCHAVMIGRAALQRPWIFQEIIEEREIPKSPLERWQIMDGHREMIQEVFGSKRGFNVMRWHAGWYVRWHPDQKKIRTQWEALDFKSGWTPLMDALKRFTLEGPQILPPLQREAHDQVEAG